MVTSEESCAISANSLSAGGQEEQPWLVKSSITARGWVCARAGVTVQEQQKAST